MSDYFSHEEAQEWETWLNWIDWSAYDGCASTLGDTAAAVSTKERRGLLRTIPCPIKIPAVHSASTRSQGDESHAGRQGQKRDWSNVVVTSSRASAKVTKLALRCTIEDCTYTRTFTRQYELDRHIATAHEKQKPFWCPVKGCFKGTAPPSFSRSDKLTSHIRSTHGFDRETKCPKTGCATALPLDLLGRHIEFGHRWTRRTSMSNCDRYCAALIHAADTNSQKCPYWPCSQHLHLKDLYQHMQSHSIAELQYMVAELRVGGYVFTLPSQPETFAEIWVVCPVCHESSEGHEDFAKHLLVSHMTNPGKPDPEQMTSLDSKLMQQFFKGNWKSNLKVKDRKDRKLDTHCHGCGKEGHWEEMRHRHDCGIMRNEEEIIAELRPHRQALLRLCPEFGACKVVFEDLISTES